MAHGHAATPHELLQRSCQGLPGHKALVAGPRKAATCSGVTASRIFFCPNGWLGWLGSPLQSPHGIVMAVKSKKTCAEGLGPMRNNFEVEQKRLGEPKDMARMQNISYIEIYRKK